MMTKKRKRLAVVCLIVALISAFSLAMFVGAGARDSYEFVFSATLENSYKYGDTVEIPSATYAGKEVRPIVNMPDGTSTDKTEITIDQTGEYMVDYIAQIPNTDEYAKKTLSFSVYKQMFSVKGNGYTEYRKVNGNVGGLYARLTKGDTLVYNDVIDLNDFSATDLLFKAGIIASAPGEADVNQFEVRLTDIYDESIYVVYRVKKFADGGQYETVVSYLDCGFGGAYCGLERSGTGNFTYTVGGKTETYKGHINSEKYGCNTMLSMTGGTAAVPFDGTKMFGLTLDGDNGQTFVYLYDYGKTPYYPVIISDLYNENIYGEKFEGFTDGKVKISFTPTKFAKSECGLFFTEIGGKGISESNWNKLDTENAPVISVDTLGYDIDNVPPSKLGAMYKVFDAAARDVIDGALECEVKVYYGYSNARKVRINVENGEFKTDYKGEYTIEYTAVNSAGNKTVTLVRVNCVETSEELSLTLNGENDYSPVAAGSRVKLFDSYEIKNNLGKGELKVECILGDVVYTPDEDNCFTPYYAGDYTIRYTFSDFSDEKTLERRLTVNAADVVDYEQTANLPPYFVKNGQYDLGVVKAYSASSGKLLEVPVKIYVKNDGVTERTEVTGEYVVTANDSVEIIYVADVGFAAREFTITRKVVDIGLGGRLDKSKLFVPETEGVSFVHGESSVDCIFDPSAENVKFSFANVLARDSFGFTLTPYSGFKPFGSFDIFLKDFENPEDKVKISFFPQGSAWYVAVNDGKTLKVASEWGGANDTLIIAYDIAKGALTVGGNVFRFDTYLGGDKKITFDRGVLFEAEVKGVNGCGGVSILELNGQSFAGRYDYIGPQIDTSRTAYFGEKPIGYVMTVGDYFCADVITPYAKCVYTVRLNGKVLAADDGTLLENVNGDEMHVITIKEYGDYTFSIKAVDQNDNETPISPKVTVVDYTPPTLQLTKKVESGRVNSKIAFAKYTVGNDKGGYKAFITVLDPKGTMKYYGEETSFTPTVKGKYVVTVSVVDKNGNIGEESYTVTVS